MLYEVITHPDIPLAITNLDHRPGLDEQPGHADRIRQGAAAVVTQVQNQPGDVVLIQFLQFHPQVIGHVAVGFTAVVPVEGRDLDVADLLLAFLL